jgi:hypothetical protein
MIEVVEAVRAEREMNGFGLVIVVVRVGEVFAELVGFRFELVVFRENLDCCLDSVEFHFLFLSVLGWAPSP